MNILSNNIIFNPIAAAVYLAHLGINIALLFLLIQLILTWKYFAWLTPLDKVGKPVTDAMTGAVSARIESRFGERKFSERGRLSICIVILTLADSFLAAIAGAMQ